ncbi:TPA: aspartate aminotransferase family protein [Clostridioides difficile]|nr:aspartate aminotransferase family protein [Clostridioides difficile]
MKNKKYISPILENIRNTDFTNDLTIAHNYAVEYINTVDNMRVYPDKKALNNLSRFDENLCKTPTSNAEILHQLGKYGSKATVAQSGGRYFGFVCGGILPSSLCSKWITDVWDQNPALYVLSPISSKLEDICEKWIVKLLGLPENTSVGFVSGSSTAIICGLLAARNYLLNKLEYNVSKKGLFDSPKIKVVLSEGAHSTIFKSLSIIGLGQESIIKVPMDEQGRILVAKIPPLDNSTIVILQAGNVNTGSFDNFEEVCKKAKDVGAWVHIDGAFGLWAAANNTMSDLSKGIELADSWNMDAHKTLNSPYDNGIVLCRHRESLVNAMHMTDYYIVLSKNRDSMMYTMEMSRRARAIDIWATLKGLGSDGVSELVEELHYKAKYFSDCLIKHNFEILNEVVFNQVLAYFKNDTATEELIRRIQESGVCWLGGSKWNGKSVMRISISSYKTTYEDIDICIEEIVKLSKTL